MTPRSALIAVHCSMCAESRQQGGAAKVACHTRYPVDETSSRGDVQCHPARGARRAAATRRRARCRCRGDYV